MKCLICFLCEQLWTVSIIFLGDISFGNSPNESSDSTIIYEYNEQEKSGVSSNNSGKWAIVKCKYNHTCIMFCIFYNPTRGIC